MVHGIGYGNMLPNLGESELDRLRRLFNLRFEVCMS